ncbi:MAG: CCA tRNA nucleotidyltransferase [Alphaproteobacteria bacterium]
MNAPAWLSDAALQQFFAAVQQAGGEARAVGGSVRDFLLGAPGGDVDLAATLEPPAVMALAKAQGWKAIPTGIDHGTVTVVLPSRVVEVTTLRRDVATDGRHAKVAYTDRWEEDAARRDFTINALYMDAGGNIHDYFGGQKDLKARTVRFIGDAGRRIEEDGLRILRYFRFLAVLGWSTEKAALAACGERRQMLAVLSGERIQQEMKKLLAARDPSAVLGAMAQLELPALLTESPWDVSPVAALVGYEREQLLAGDPWVRLLAMIDADVRLDTALWTGERWKLSRAERQALAVLAAPAAALDPAAVKESLRKHPRPLVTGRILLAALDSDEEMAIDALLRLAQDWEIPQFPVTAKDLLKLGMKEGPELGRKLKALEQRWVESDYRLGRDQLLT